MKFPLRLFVAACAVAALAPLPALAQKSLGPKAKIFAKYDTNKNGVIDGDEIAALRKDFAADPDGELKRFDTNHDGKLSDEEIAAIKPPGASGGGKKGGEKKTKEPTPAPTDTATSAAPASPTPTPST